MACDNDKVPTNSSRHGLIDSGGVAPTAPGVEVVVDQGDTQASEALVDHAKSRYGAIDVFLVNAGVGKFATLDRADEAHFDSIFGINVRGLYFITKHAAPAITNGGAITFAARPPDRRAGRV